MKINELIDGFSIWTTNEERLLLKKIGDRPTPISGFTEHEQFKIESMIRKSLITKIGHKDPLVVANEKDKKI